MLNLLKTLVMGETNRAEERLRDHYALDLIAQTTRESESALAAAKASLAALIQRHRAAGRQVEALAKQIDSLSDRARAAMTDDKQTLAEEAAKAIAAMENEKTLRTETCAQLDQRVLRLRSSVDKMHRRIIDLKQGEIAAKAARHEANVQSKLNRTIARDASADEAQALIDRVLGEDDPFEEAAILDDIDADLSPAHLEDRLAAAGYGPSTKTTAADVLARFTNA